MCVQKIKQRTIYKNKFSYDTAMNALQFLQKIESALPESAGHIL